MPVYKKASARGQLQPRHGDAYEDEDDDDNAVTRFQRRSPLPGSPIAARIAPGARPRSRSIDDEAMTVLLDRASLFPPVGRSKGARISGPAPNAPTAPTAVRATRVPSEPPPTLTRPRMTMPARAPSASPPPLPPARPSAPAPAVTISQPPAAAVAGARSRVATDTLRTRRQGGARWRFVGALLVLVVGGSAGAVITSVVARSRGSIAAEPLPAIPVRAMELPMPAADSRTLGAAAACAVGEPAGATMPTDRADGKLAITGLSARHGAHRSATDAIVARRAATPTTASTDAGADAEAAPQDDFAAAAEALSKAKLETTLP